MTVNNAIPLACGKASHACHAGAWTIGVAADRRLRGSWLVSLLLSVVSTLTLASSAVYADAPTFTVRRLFGTGTDHIYSLAMGDVDGDGHLDLITGNSRESGFPGEQNVVYLNDGQGNFPNNEQYRRAFGTGNDQTRSVAVGDVNGDGHLDLVTGNNGEQSFVYLNDGQGNFPNNEQYRRPFGTGSDRTLSVAVGDINGDGHLDIVTGNEGQQSFVYLNDGHGNFLTAQGRAFGTGNDRTLSVAAGDVNGDSHLDIVMGNEGQQSFVYLNDGQGNFPTAEGRPFGTNSNRTLSVAVGDVNGDNHLDIVTGTEGQDVLYLNDGQGNFANTRPFGTGNDQTRSVAVGDVDGDGHLDLVIGNQGVPGQQNFFYLNDGQGNFANRHPFGTGDDGTTSVAVGDVNGDGHLDIATGNWQQQNIVYLNDGQGNFATTGRSFGTGSDWTRQVAVGDMNGDGHLDIVTGNWQQQNTVYLNDGQGNFPTGHPFGTGDDRTLSVAVGDVNDDSYLDIVTGNYERQNFVYLNDGQGNFPNEEQYRRPFGTGTDNTYSVAVGDVNGDSHLDLVTGNLDWQPNFVYLNDGQGNFPNEEQYRRPFGTGQDFTYNAAVGDVDGDGHLDLVTGNNGQNAVYLNDGQGNFLPERGRSFGTGNQATIGMAVGDMDGDGHLDIVTGNNWQQNFVYLNDGQGNFPSDERYRRPFGTGSDDDQSVAVGDMDGDGDLDIVSGNYERAQNRVYLNDGQGNFAIARPFGTSSDNTYSVALGDVNGDGHLDIVRGNNGQPNVVYLNRMQRVTGLANQGLQLTVTRPGPTANANFFSSPTVLDSPIIPVRYTLFDAEGDWVGRVAAFYSPDGGGRWLPAVAATGTTTQHLATAPDGVTHTFNWDTFASGFFGQSDNVVVRLVAYRQPLSTTLSIAGAYRYTNTVAGPYQWPYASATTFPFRARGTQVRVMESDGEPVADALVYRLPAGQVEGALPFGNALPFRTSGQGYLSGRGQMARGDRLVALQPVSLPDMVAAQVMSDTLRFYYTSAPPMISGLAAMTITQSGVQTLTVSAQNPLLIFNLKVALEWDARKDPQYLSQLEFNLKRASALLYDWSNGQVALGQVTVYHDAPRLPSVDGWQPWRDAHIRIYATNTLRPSAGQGGIIKDVLSETVATGKTVTYSTGQVRIGAIWNRYGEASGNLGEDWPRALAHELGHYLLFLDDNYLGVDGQGRLITIPAEQCPGAMNNPYSDLHSEFHPQSDWLPACQQTLSARDLDRSDWESITTHYPMLKLPTGAFQESATAPAATAGPTLLPLAVTQVTFRQPITPAQTLDAPIFSLLQKDAGVVVAGNSAHAYLYPADSPRLIDFGRPTLDQVLAYGAQPGDRLCVYELAAERQGCLIIQPGVDQLQLVKTPPWQPEVRLSPMTSTTLQISVTAAIDGFFEARLYPVDAPATAPIALRKINGVYIGAFELTEPALEGYVQVQGQVQGQGVEVVTAYALGGNPVHHRSRRVHHRSRRAPAISTDGQVIVFGEQLDEKQDEEWIFSVQAATTAVDALPWATLVGQAYWLLATPNAPSLQGATISFQYLGDDVPAGEESFLRIYYREAKDATRCPSAFQSLPCWRPLATTLDTFYNFAAAPLEGPGLYALMSSIELPLTGAGWNLFAYPVQGVRPVAEALQSIKSAYSVVWGYDPADPDPWHFYAPAAPAWANDLADLQFGKGYWLYITAPGQITLYLQGQAGMTAAQNRSALGLPAVYYGTILSNATLTAVAGMPITAWIEGHRCGATQTRAIDGQIVYVIKVAAEDGTAHAGCGADDRTVTLQVEGTAYQEHVAWHNAIVKLVDLPSTDDGVLQLFLPLIANN